MSKPLVPPDLEIRRGEPRDHADLAALRWEWRVVEEGAAGGSLTDFTVRFTAWAEKHAATHLPYVAVTEDKVVGMSWLAIIDRIPGPVRWRRRVGILQSVYVLASYRQRGIGESMVRVVIEAARDLELDYLTVHPTERAFSLYRRVGFVAADRKSVV